jgi:hypothetical protein
MTRQLSVGQNIVGHFAGIIFMEWKIEIIDENKYIEVITSGIADTDGSLNMAKEIKNTMKANRITKALIDHRNLVSVTGDILDIYDRPKIFRIIGVILRIKIAEIIKPEHLEHFKFFETVCVNRGYQLFVFQDKEKALSWLLTWAGK